MIRALALQLGLMLVELHGPSGQKLVINSAEISSLREPIDVGGHHWARGTHCIVVMSNGGVNAVAETCDEVRSKLQ